jgi:putative DNA primase/helicase
MDKSPRETIEDLIKNADRVAPESFTWPESEESLHDSSEVMQSESQANTPWPDPQPLTIKIKPESYPVGALPQCMAAAVLEVANFVKAPVPMITSSALSALSIAIQTHVDIKRTDTLISPSGLFLITIAESGERKSTVDSYFMRPFVEYEESEREAAKPLLKEFDALLEAWEAKVAGLKDKIRQLTKDGKPTDLLEAALKNLHLERPEAPMVPRLLYADTTPEALAFNLAKGWPSSGVVAAEGGLVIGSHGMGKDSVTRNLAMLNQLWDGKPLSVDRRTSESFIVDHARLTVSLMVQAATLQEFHQKSGALARGIGFFARFLISHPESTQGYRPFSEEPDSWPALSDFNRRIAEILARTAPFDERKKLLPSLMSLSPEAKNLWIEYYNEVEMQLRDGGDLTEVKDIASKSADNAARIAVLLQVFEHGFGSQVSAECFESASRIAAWHLSEARRLFVELALPVGLANTDKLNDWLVKHCQRSGVVEVPKSETMQKGPLRAKETLDPAIKQLTELGRVRLAKIGSRLTIQVNPALIGGRDEPV